jgi:hypothetical protein
MLKKMFAKKTRNYDIAMQSMPAILSINFREANRREPPTDRIGSISLIGCANWSANTKKDVAFLTKTFWSSAVKSVCWMAFSKLRIPL